MALTRGLTKGDKILIFMILVFCSFGLIIGKTYTYGAFEKKYIVIEVKGTEVKRFILGQDTENKKIEIKGMLGYSIIEIGKDRVRMYQSPCDNGDCLKVGWISKPGQMIVCLPNQVAVKIIGSRDTLDDTTY